MDMDAVVWGVYTYLGKRDSASNYIFLSQKERRRSAPHLSQSVLSYSTKQVRTTAVPHSNFRTSSKRLNQRYTGLLFSSIGTKMSH